MFRNLIAGILLSGVACASVDETALDTWFARAPAARGEIPAVWSAVPLDSKEAANLAATRVWQGYRDGARKFGWDQQLAPLPPTLEEFIALPADQDPHPCGIRRAPLVALRRPRRTRVASRPRF